MAVLNYRAADSPYNTGIVSGGFPLTGLPHAPGDGEAHFNWARREWFHWDESLQLFLGPQMVVAMPCDIALPTTPTPVAGLLRGQIPLWIDSVSVAPDSSGSGWLVQTGLAAILVATTNNGSNFWSFEFRRTTGGTGTTLASWSTASASANVWTRIVAPINVVLANNSFDHLEMVLSAKTGAPGAFYVTGVFLVRPVLYPPR